MRRRIAAEASGAQCGGRRDEVAIRAEQKAIQLLPAAPASAGFRRDYRLSKSGLTTTPRQDEPVRLALVARWRRSITRSNSDGAPSDSAIRWQAVASIVDHWASRRSRCHRSRPTQAPPQGPSGMDGRKTGSVGDDVEPACPAEPDRRERDSGGSTEVEVGVRSSSPTLTLDVLMTFPPIRGPCEDDPDARFAVSVSGDDDLAGRRHGHLVPSLLQARMTLIRRHDGVSVAERHCCVFECNAMLDEVRFRLLTIPRTTGLRSRRPPPLLCSSTRAWWREPHRMDCRFTPTHLPYSRDVTVAARRLATPSSVNAAIKQIADVMRCANYAGALQYVPELSWILFLRILDEREELEAEEAEAVGASFIPSLEPPYRVAGLGVAWRGEARRAERGRDGRVPPVRQLGCCRTSAACAIARTRRPVSASSARSSRRSTKSMSTPSGTCSTSSIGSTRSISRRSTRRTSSRSARPTRACSRRWARRTTTAASSSRPAR